MIYLYGLSISGESLIRYFNAKKISFLAWDDNDKQRKNLKKKYKKINLINPKKIKWENIKEIYVSPGIDLNINIFNRPKKFQIPIYRDLELYSQKRDNKKVIAITGTNGKSTSVKLLSDLFKKNKINHFVGGNYGTPLFDVFNKEKKYQFDIIELSSFQLESAPSFKSLISVLLNISIDHQERYKNVNEYIKTKERIFCNGNFNYGIISVDDKYCKKIYIKNSYNKKKLIPISIIKKLSHGVSIRDNYIYDNFFKKGFCHKFDKSSSLNGEFNNQNILISYIVSKLLKLNFELFNKTISFYKGLPHRLEKIYESKKLIIINNSKATNMNSTLESIKIYENIFLILGGKIKANNFNDLKIVKNKILQCFVIGKETEFIYNQILDYFPTYKSYQLHNAINQIFKEINKTSKKIIILFSPACSSFDQFKNFEDRGNKFKKLIKHKVSSYE